MKNEASQAKDAGASVFGYIALCELAPDLFRGGMLVMDHHGKPMDFRCTSAIKPSAIQKVLYGGSLSGHLSVGLCGGPLLKAAGVRPSILMVDRPSLLDVRSDAAMPVLWVRRQSDLQTLAASGPVGDEHEVIASESGLFDPVLVACHRDFAGDLRDGIGRLRELAGVLDPLEPFGRIAAALKLVQDKAGGR